MAVIITWVLVLAIFLLVLAFASLSRQKSFLESYAKDLENTLNDAKKVREDLNFLLDNAVRIAEKINGELQEKIKNKEEIIVKQESMENESYADRKVKAVEGMSKRIRIYQGAKYLGIDNRTLIEKLREMGYEVNSQLNMIEMEILDEIKYSMAGNGVQNDKKEEVSNVSYVETASGEKSYAPDDLLEAVRNAHPYMAVRILYERGYSIKEIAKFLGRGQGEVQILLNLAYKNKAI